MLKPRWMALVAAVLFLGSSGTVIADISMIHASTDSMIHASTEMYYENGSTFIDFEPGYGSDYWVGPES